MILQLSTIIKNVLFKFRIVLYNNETINREYNSFSKIKDESPKFVISLDKKDTSRNEIIHLNIIDFLTGKIDITFFNILNKIYTI